MLCSSTDPKTELCYGDSNTWGHDAATSHRFAPSIRWPGVVQNILTTTTINIIEAGLNGRTFATCDPQCTWLAPNADAGGRDCNGRMSLMPVLHSAKPVHILVLALGVNDLKSRFSLTPKDIASGCGLLIDDVRSSGLLCPDGSKGHCTGPAGLEGVAIETTEMNGGGTNKAPKIVVVAPPPITNEKVIPDFANGGIQRSLELANELEDLCRVKRVDGFIRGGDLSGCVCSETDGIHLTAEAHAALGARVAEVVQSLL